MSLHNALKSFHAHVAKLSDGTVDGLIEWFSKAGILDKSEGAVFGVTYMGSEVEDTVYLKEGNCTFAFINNWKAMARPDDQVNRFHAIIPMFIDSHVLYFGCGCVNEKDVELATLSMIVKLTSVKHDISY